MERALWSAVTGMRAQELSLDVISNNLANVNTAGFKNSRVRFQDMLYASLVIPGAASSNGEVGGVQVGHGTRVAGSIRSQAQGALIESGNLLDFAIEGDGFFEIVLPDGESAFTRDGAFSLNGAGELITPDGYRVAGFDTIDPGTTDITVARDGSFTAIVNGESVAKGRITLARFLNPEGLNAIGRNLFQETEASGAPETGLNPGERGVGGIAHRYLERSNVNTATELVNMISTQRAYEATSKAIRTSDEMLATANQLAR
ncbi:MAG: flagellar basal-body rod protein FlgG [Lentisphaerae bacterium]|nr:flagellar basal-body rod protein FlgG [Lentisphaerota bacterium]